jgi:peptidoglycan/LPS O-acetylase OafA/YrhL
MATFRTDIHGLRGISVLLVLLFHFETPGFAGGYIGVDIFFVISGYLITNIILNQQKSSGGFKLREFYVRRIKRILPAALATLLIFSVVGSILLPLRIEQFAQETIYATFGVSNFYYGSQAGYFAPQATEFLFLNYWSLAVEEQFYLFWPILLILIASLIRNLRTVLWIIFPLVLMAMITWAQAPNPAFYHLVGRSWELMAGAFLSIAALSNFPISFRGQKYVGVIFVLTALICAELGFENFEFGIIALAVIGAAFVIEAGRIDQTGYVFNVLSSKLLMFFGTISYSLYLVHWPLKTLVFLVNGRPLIYTEYIAVFILSVGVATLLYYTIESPFRKVERRSTRVFSSAVVGVLALTAMTQSLRFLPELISPPSSRALAEYAFKKPEPKECMASEADKYPGLDNCVFGADTGDDIKLWLVGDSHAAHWKPGLDALLKKHELKSVLFAYNSALPILDIRQYKNVDFMVGSDTWRTDLKNHLETAPPSSIILAARWSIYFETEQFHNRPTKFYAKSQDNGPLDKKETQRAIELGLINTVNTLKSWGHDVILLGQVPEFGTPQADCVERALNLNDDPDLCGPGIDKIIARLRPAHEMLIRVSENTRADLILPDQYLCDDNKCRQILDGIYLYRDDDHLNPQGSKNLVSMLSPQFIALIAME